MLFLALPLAPGVPHVIGNLGRCIDDDAAEHPGGAHNGLNGLPNRLQKDKWHSHEGQKARGWSRSWSRGQDGDRASVRPGRGRLIGQVPVQGLETGVGQVERRDPVVGVPLNGVGDVRRLRAGQQDWDESRPAGLVVVDPVVDQIPLPVYPEALTRAPLGP